MKASVTIDAGKVEGAVLVPNAAVTAGKVSVRGKDGQVTERSVVVGRSDGTSVEIRKGLSEGEEVIIPGKK
jgi:multidrug efflux pump subunit AcrA (membrane-fusion protein)